jgi:transposase
VKRYAVSGLEGLKNLPRTGRTPQVSGQKFAEIKRELSENLAGWRAKEVMNIIYDMMSDSPSIPFFSYLLFHL